MNFFFDWICRLAVLGMSLFTIFAFFLTLSKTPLTPLPPRHDKKQVPMCVAKLLVFVCLSCLCVCCTILSFRCYPTRSHCSTLRGLKRRLIIGIVRSAILKYPDWLTQSSGSNNSKRIVFQTLHLFLWKKRWRPLHLRTGGRFDIVRSLKYHINLFSVAIFIYLDLTSYKGSN